MIAAEIVVPGGTTPDPLATAAVSRACHERGLLTLTCGTDGNVLRFLPPLVMDAPTLERGLDILDAAVAHILS
jgi:4-aminobutyrate aminotransferase/(S)-3-amino-2-methylpropionate transaminase